MASRIVLKFYAIQFDDSWGLTSTTDQLFTYQSKNQNALIRVSYEAPTGQVKGVTLSCDGKRGAIVHRDVLHVMGKVKTLTKGDILNKG